MMTKDDLDAALAPVGLSCNQVVRGGMRIDGVVEGRGIMVVVDTYCVNAEGKRYIDDTGEVATETRRFYLSSLGPLVPADEGALV